MHKPIYKFILDLLFPKYCLSCQKEGDFICVACFQNIKLNKLPNCFLCGRRSLDGSMCVGCKSKTKLTGVLVASSWDDLLLRQLIYEYKYRFIQDLAGPLAQILIETIKTNYLFYHPVDSLILSPVPLHHQRLQWRGFNQAELLAKEIAMRLDIPMAKLLERQKNTKPQAEIKKENERKLNIKSAFTISQKYSSLLQNKIVILVDDITTTGSTLEECAKILKPLKPKEIWGLVLARG